MKSKISEEVQTVYQQLLEAWNHRNAQAMSKLFKEEGESIGFDGSQSVGREEIFSHLKPIFEHHPTAKFVGKVKQVHILTSNIVMIRAIAGMIPVGQTDLNPQLNTHHTLILIQEEGTWRIQLLQNTPAQFHGRPELVEQMTEELRQLIK